MTCVLIDDEASALSTLSGLLSEFCPTVEVLGTASDVPSGLSLIEQTHPDLIFLDIQMPKQSGFDLIKQLPEDGRPEVIFVTSQDEYGLRAIRCAALGYVLKPIELKELLRAVQQVQRRLPTTSGAERISHLIEHVQDVRSAPQRIGIPSEKGMDFVEVKHILHCEGLDRLTRIHVRGQKPIVSSYSIGEFRKMLEAYGFVVVHRSHLVNPECVIRYERAGTLILKDESTVPVSRKYRHTALTLWPIINK